MALHSAGECVVDSLHEKQMAAGPIIKLLENKQSSCQDKHVLLGSKLWICYTAGSA